MLAAVAARCPALAPVAAALLPPATSHLFGGRRVVARRGVDQGCPLSPALFGIAVAACLEVLLTALRFRDGSAAVWSYLDDVYIQVDPQHAEWAVQAAGEAFAPVGLELRPDKTQVWCPDAAVAAEHGFQGGRDLTCLGSPVPFVRAVGAHRFAVAHPSASFGEALARLQECVAALEALHAAGLSLHAVLVLLRTFSDGAAVHLQRAALSDAGQCRQWDDVVAASVGRLLGRALPAHALEQCFLPAKLGGLGFQSAQRRRAAALLGSWELVLHEVAGALGLRSAAQFRDTLPGLCAEIDAAAAAQRALGDRDYEFAWEACVAGPQAKRQAALTAALTEAAAEAFPAGLPTDQHRAEFGDCQGTGAGEFLLPQLDPADKLDDDTLAVCLRARLLLPWPCQDDAALGAAGPTTQCHKRLASGLLCGLVFASAADRHSWWCSAGGSVKRGHDRVRDWLAVWLRQRTGSSASLEELTEQHVPEWDVQPAGGHGPVQRAVLDVVFTDRTGRRGYADVTFASAGTGSAAELARRAATPGKSLEEAVGEKRRRYRPERAPSVGLVPFAVGALGRVSPEAHGLLAATATDGQDARRALQHLSALTQQRLADVLRASEPRAA